MERLDPSELERYDSLFVAPHGDDAMLACPARMQAEFEKRRRVLLIALFEPVGLDTKAARAARSLGADYVAAGLPSVRDRRGAEGGVRLAERQPEDEDTAFEAARLLADTVPRTRAVHIFAPLGLGASADHLLAYEASVRALATEPGRNLFLYEERPEAFVPGAVRTRLALLGARLPPEAQRAAGQSGLLRHLLAVSEPRRLRGEKIAARESLAALFRARRRFRAARPWNPLRAFGPRLQPVVHLADEEAMRRARAIAEALLPADRRGRPRAAERFNARASAATKKLGGVYHAERLWLFLPSGDGLPEVEHPLEFARG
jgi:LmbE family N-acetylglucosaminyl deacetylase